MSIVVLGRFPIAGLSEVREVVLVADAAARVPSAMPHVHLCDLVTSCPTLPKASRRERRRAAMARKRASRRAA